jgi:hypothetical protein
MGEPDPSAPPAPPPPPRQQGVPLCGLRNCDGKPVKLARGYEEKGSYPTSTTCPACGCDMAVGRPPGAPPHDTFAPCPHCDHPALTFPTPAQCAAALGPPDLRPPPALSPAIAERLKSWSPRGIAGGAVVGAAVDAASLTRAHEGVYPRAPAHGLAAPDHEQATAAPLLVWVDLETAGGSAATNGAIVELAYAVTTPDAGEVLEHYSALVVPHAGAYLDAPRSRSTASTGAPPSSARRAPARRGARPAVGRAAREPQRPAGARRGARHRGAVPRAEDVGEAGRPAGLPAARRARGRGHAAARARARGAQHPWVRHLWLDAAAARCGLEGLSLRARRRRHAVPGARPPQARRGAARARPRARGPRDVVRPRARGAPPRAAGREARDPRLPRLKALEATGRRPPPRRCSRAPRARPRPPVASLQPAPPPADTRTDAPAPPPAQGRLFG